MERPTQLRLLLIGAIPRVIGGAFIVAALWVGFFWATQTLGAL